MITAMKQNRATAFGTIPNKLTNPMITNYHAGQNAIYGKSPYQRRNKLFSCCDKISLPPPPLSDQKSIVITLTNSSNNSNPIQQLYLVLSGNGRIEIDTQIVTFTGSFDGIIPCNTSATIYSNNLTAIKCGFVLDATFSIDLYNVPLLIVLTVDGPVNTSGSFPTYNITDIKFHLLAPVLNVIYIRPIIGEAGYYSNNNILFQTFDCSLLPVLTELYISSYNSKQLNNIINMPSTIQILYISNNMFSSINISNLINLHIFDCHDNILTTLDLTNNTQLTGLDCGSNLLNTLDLTNNIQLTTLVCNDNALTTLNVSNNTLLTILECNNNPLTTPLDLTNNTLLETLICSNDSLNTLDLTNNTLLTSLFCNDNLLTTLDLTNNTLLTSLYCDNNSLTTLDLTNNTQLIDIRCRNNQINQSDANNIAGELLNNNQFDGILNILTQTSGNLDMTNNLLALVTQLNWSVD